MKNIIRGNTLFLGNGFSRTVFRNVPTWNSLFSGSNSVTNNTIRYEMHRLQKKYIQIEEAAIKTQLIKQINEPFSEKNLSDAVDDLDRFGEYLSRYNVNDIITTNYDTGVEFLLRRCGYSEQKIAHLTPERVYSIRTYKLYSNADLSHNIRIWKIHGDIDRPASITLGFDQYCGSLGKLTEYVKGTYSASHNNKVVACKTHMKDKCNHNTFDDISWVELFFNSNVYIVGFGMYFEEIDIWWLLNKRARFKGEGVSINNSITYLFNPEYETIEEKRPVYDALDAFGVVRKPIRTSASYFETLFSFMENKMTPDLVKTT